MNISMHAGRARSWLKLTKTTQLVHITDVFFLDKLDIFRKKFPMCFSESNKFVSMLDNPVF